eukprot:scaffold64138_cov30-Tisochrysis_lutea.AAC.1
MSAGLPIGRKSATRLTVVTIPNETKPALPHPLRVPLAPAPPDALVRARPWTLPEQRAAADPREGRLNWRFYLSAGHHMAPAWQGQRRSEFVVATG